MDAGYSTLLQKALLVCPPIKLNWTVDPSVPNHTLTFLVQRFNANISLEIDWQVPIYIPVFIRGGITAAGSLGSPRHGVSQSELKRSIGDEAICLYLTKKIKEKMYDKYWLYIARDVLAYSDNIASSKVATDPKVVFYFHFLFLCRCLLKS